VEEEVVKVVDVQVTTTNIITKEKLIEAGDEGESAYQKLQCYYCKNYGHIKQYCRLKEKQANFVEEKEKDEIESLFLACYSAKECVPDDWFIESGCSNHMTPNLEAFISLDKFVTSKVKMGDGTICSAHGKGNINTSSAIDQWAGIRCGTGLGSWCMWHM
jgi:hypothetical protein